MPAITYPNLGLKAGYDPGENGWGDDVTLDIIKVSILTQGNFIDKYSAEPGSPTDGDVIILDETEVTNPNAVAVWFDDPGAWLYFTPQEGWLLYNQTQDYFEKFDGTVWAELETGGSGIPPGGSTGQVLTKQSATDGDADWDDPVISGQPVSNQSGDTYNLDPALVGYYCRYTNAGAKTLTVQANATVPQQQGAEWNIRNVGAGDLTLVEDTGVTINPPSLGTLVVASGGTVTLKRVAVDEYDLIGQTVPA